MLDDRLRRALTLGALALAAAPAPAFAQAKHQGDNMSGMDMAGDKRAPVAPPAAPADHIMPDAATSSGAMSHGGMPHGGTPHDGMPSTHDMAAMPAMFGPYVMTREASGTSWQPDSSPNQAVMFNSGDWTGMAEATATLVHGDQGGPRGGTKDFSQSMAMVMASRPVGDRGRFGLRAMASLDPLMGRSGYPLLFATGETADGRSELVDRQHPHDFLMELAASYSHDLGGGKALFLYAGLPGEPALGPPAFMHRLSAMDNPEAPIGHHWFDSTHITWGVLTTGFSTRHWKIEASAFKGREPDQRRWDVESPKLDSWSVRTFWNPNANLSLQASTGYIHSGEQLHPEVNEQRTTVSASHNLPLGPRANWATTIAWSLKDERPGPSLKSWLAETALRFASRHTLYARAERTQESELFPEGDPLHHDIIPVNKLTLGYQYALPLSRNFNVALGGLASAYTYPNRITPAYGADGIKSFMLYMRANYGARTPAL